ncbi:hypothetical protein C7C46_24590 [Streptomyces tateyamensis]|uniref:Glycoside hydrolase n=1 Tax=Streptomyces tateyamensis TaxID=565073 RepID=A0A2V4MWX4_9ACTN|nr:hypothetical protein [Streptomyces tateyamensis]PYC73992.1 hypothetical protein C7C46_24590 [Streptomyces tateyamensis]
MPRTIRRPGPAVAVLLLLIAALLGALPGAARAAVPIGPPANIPGTAPVPAGVTVSGVDLHDGQIQKFGSTYYLYGTMYNCGYTWQQQPTPWCGFGVSTASSMSGPWSTPVMLFSKDAPDPYNPGHTYQDVCGNHRSGCFSPRMVQRSGWGAGDNVFVLWFNAPAYMSLPAPNTASHAYMTMGCNGPTGPCGASAGAPYGTTHRPTLHQCDGANGDPGLTADSERVAVGEPSSIALICPSVGTTSVSVEQLDKWGTNGTGVGVDKVPGIANAEAMGAYRDASGTWVMTFADHNCGYCAGTGAGYATAPHMLGPWTVQGNKGVGQSDDARRIFSPGSCGGQVDTVSVIDGQAWEKIDLWTGAMNEKGANLRFEPLNFKASSHTAGDGQVWRPELAAFGCTDAPPPATAPPAPVTISGVDLHDGQIQKFGSTYYLYGTMYNCGYTWLATATQWCGFGVSTASSMNGPWSTPQLLFSATADDPYYPGHTYQAVCGSGSGCFSPRMIQRSGWGANDGVFILWFNAPGYKNLPAPYTATNGYMTMGCNGPTGPCGASAGAPYGTTHRPSLHQCDGANGDAGLSTSVEDNTLALVCPMPGTGSLSLEELSYWGTDGSGTGITHLGKLDSTELGNVESTGLFKDSASHKWVLTYADKNCGFCSGTGTGYATADTLTGTWTAPANTGVYAAGPDSPAHSRRQVSANSCGGKPDTVSVIDGQAWQKINLWTGSTAPAGSGLLLEPLSYQPSGNKAGDGQPWLAELAPFTCPDM